MLRLILSLVFFIPATAFVVALRMGGTPASWIIGALVGVVVGLVFGGVKRDWLDALNPLNKPPEK